VTIAAGAPAPAPVPAPPTTPPPSSPPPSNPPPSTPPPSTPPPSSPPPTVGAGIPVGSFHLPDDRFGQGPYTGALRALAPGGAENTLAAAAAKGVRLVVSLPDSRKHYTNADGTFNLSLWKQQMDRWRPYAAMLQRYYDSGTILANYLVDEPGCTQCWGGKTIAYADIEEMGRYAKAFLPRIPTAVRVHPGWFRAAGRPFPSIDVSWAQYEGPLHKPSVNMTPEQFRDRSVADAKAMGMGLVLGLNVLDGGDGSSGINGAMLISTRWQMSADEVAHAGTVFAAEPYACAVINWRYSTSYSPSGKSALQLANIQGFDGRSDVRSALARVASVAKSRPAKACQ
jgi:hypothetical protein